MAQEYEGIAREQQRVIVALSPAKQQLLLFIETQAVALLGIIRSYVQTMRLVPGEEARPMALEVLQETVVEALAHVERFDPQRPCMAWLLGIALNVIRRKKVELTKLRQHEIQLRQFSTCYQGVHSDNELLEQLYPTTFPGPEKELEEHEQAALLLALVSPEDQHILRLALLEGFGREALAKQLGVTPGAARVRLHRALNRLRVAWMRQHDSDAERNIV